MVTQLQRRFAKGDGSSSVSSAGRAEVISTADRDTVSYCAATFPEELGETSHRTTRQRKAGTGLIPVAAP